MSASEPSVESAPTQPTGRVRSWVRAALLIALLVVPSIALENWARTEQGLILYLQAGYRHRLDAKKLMFQKIDCPKSVVVGTSMTEVALNAESIRSYREMTGDSSFEPIFAFAAPGTRPIAMHGVWRWIRSQGCRPDYLFIEATPVILNIARGEDFERAFLSLRMQLDVSEERFASDDYTFKFRADLATWWRSFTYRNRQPIMRYLKARFGKKKKAKTLKVIPSDGKLKPTSERELTGKFLASQYRTTLRTFKKREFKYEFNQSYADAIVSLAEEARLDGARAVIHTPPIPTMFHEFMDLAGATTPFCELYERVRKSPKMRWYSEYGRTDLETTEFSDWLHVNRAGAKRYATRILKAASADNFSLDPYCERR